MKTSRIILSFLATLLLYFTQGLPSYAVPISALNSSTIAQGTIPDTDLFFLTEFFGFKAGETLDYESTLTPLSWSATLSGAYLGTGLNVKYIGDLSPSQAGQIIWSSLGTFGTSTWIGGGNIFISEIDMSLGFHVDFESSLTIGDNLGVADITIAGIASPLQILYLSSTGTASKGGVSIPIPEPSLEIDLTQTPVTIRTDIEFLGATIILNDLKREPAPPPAEPGGSIIEGQITTVIEPSTFALLISGIVLICLTRRFFDRSVKFKT
jgi:hypothetical protein